MLLDRVEGDEELGPDLLVAVPPHDQGDDLGLPRRDARSFQTAGNLGPRRVRRPGPGAAPGIKGQGSQDREVVADLDDGDEVIMAGQELDGNDPETDSWKARNPAV